MKRIDGFEEGLRSINYLLTERIIGEICGLHERCVQSVWGQLKFVEEEKKNLREIIGQLKKQKIVLGTPGRTVPDVLRALKLEFRKMKKQIAEYEEDCF